MTAFRLLPEDGVAILEEVLFGLEVALEAIDDESDILFELAFFLLLLLLLLFEV